MVHYKTLQAETRLPIAEEFGPVLRAARKARGMSQEQVAAKLKCSWRSVDRWERGTRLPGADMLKAIKRVLKVAPLAE